jgi:hypothetical protein
VKGKIEGEKSTRSLHVNMKRDPIRSTDQSTEEDRVSSLYVASIARLQSMVVVVFQIVDEGDAAAALFGHDLRAARGSHDSV